MTTRFTENPTEKPINSFTEKLIESAIHDIENDNHLSMEARISSIRKAIALLKWFTSPVTQWSPVTSESIADMSILDELANIVTMTTRLSRLTAAKSYTILNDLAETVLDAGEKLSTIIGTLSKTVAEVDAEVLRRCDSTSIKDETIIFDQITGSTAGTRGTLLYDIQGGSIVLPITTLSDVDGTITDIRPNKARGAIVPAKLMTKTADIVKNGVYYSRTFSTEPRFETEADADVTLMTDKNVSTSLILEYNTDTENDLFLTEIVVIPKTPDVGIIGITLDPGDAVSIISRPNLAVAVQSVIITYNDDTVEDLTAEIMSDTITIKNATIGDPYLSFTYSPSEVLPCIVLYIQRRGIKSISITLSTDTPQIVGYPEMILMTDSGEEYMRLSYPETLIVSGYAAPSGRSGPIDWYTDNDIASLISISNAHSRRRTDLIQKFRYVLGFADITMALPMFSTSGYLDTADLFSRYADTRRIVSVELYVSEKIYPGTSIRYMICFGDSMLYELIPVNRGPAGQSRIVVRPLETGLSDVVVDTRYDQVTNHVYLRVIMTGNGYITPILKSYALRIKMEEL